MIASTEITNSEIFAFVAILVLKLLNCKVLFINRKDNKTVKKVGYCKIINSWNEKFSRYF